MKQWTMTISILALAWIGCDGGGDSSGDTTSHPDAVTAEDSTVLPDSAVDIEPQPDTPTATDTTGDTGGGTQVSGCAPWDQVGRFEIFSDPMGSWVTGIVHDAVSAHDLILQPKETEGSCTLWMGINPNFCDPQCLSDEECGEDGVCHAAPQRKSVGVVTVDGLKEPLELTANFQLEYKTWDFVGAPYEVGSAITLSASGDEIEGFVLTGTGVPPLELDDLEWIITPGQPLEINWVPEDGPWEIWFQLNVDQHGLTPVTLRCVLEDTGSYTVSAEMIDLLIEYGASGASKGRVHRRTMDSAQVSEGCIEVEVFTWQQVSPKCVDCPCTTPGQCPE